QGQGTADRSAEKLFPRRRSDENAGIDLAGARQPAVFQLAQLLCVPGNALYPGQSLQAGQTGGAGMNIESRLAQIGSNCDPDTWAVSFPIYHATVYRHPGMGQSTGYDYSRTKNPTREVLERTAAELEGGDGGFAFSSGMAALQTVF